MPKITISYRREDSGVIVGRIFDRLVAHFGTDTVFRDIDNIPYGIDYREYVNEAIGSTDILLAIIGPDWAGKTEGRTRIADLTDLVRIEVEAALRKGIPVVPVLVEKATMPQPGELPEALQALAYRNAINVDAFQDFDHHLRRLIQNLDRILESKKVRPPKVEIQKRVHTAAILPIIAGGVIILGVIAVVARLSVASPPAPAVTQPTVTPPPTPTKTITIRPAAVTPVPAPAVPPPTVTPPPASADTSQDASAMFRLGYSYDVGLGVEQDYRKAREWYEKAAAKGSADAMYNLGLLYANGHAVEQDYGKAREWFEKAAAKGSVNAGVLLAVTPR